MEQIGIDLSSLCSWSTLKVDEVQVGYYNGLGGGDDDDSIIFINIIIALARVDQSTTISIFSRSSSGHGDANVFCPVSVALSYRYESNEIVPAPVIHVVCRVSCVMLLD